jgi:hypothetical protein
LDDDGRFGPQELAWEYTAEDKKSFYSSFISGATRLPNGNTIICEGATGRLFEVTREGKTEWEYVNVFGGELTMDGRPNDVEQEARRLMGPKAKRSFVGNYALFRVTKFRSDYPGLAGKQLAPLAEQPIPFGVRVRDALARLKASESEKPSAETEKVAGDSEKPAVETEKAAAETEKSAPATEKSTGDTEKSARATEKPAAETEKSAAQPGAKTSPSGP